MWMCVSKEISSWVLLVGIFMTMILKILCKTALAFQQQLFVDISQGNFTEICAPAIQLGTTFIFYANYTTQLKMCNKNYMHSNVRKICTFFLLFLPKKIVRIMFSPYFGISKWNCITKPHNPINTHVFRLIHQFCYD